MVEKKVADPRGRLTRLLKFTSGDAKGLIKHCIHEPEEIGFDKAINLLDKEYGDKQLLTSLYLNKLRKWPKVSPNDSAAYKKLHRFLLSGLTFKRDGRLSELDSDSVIRTCVLAKMDRTVQDKWLNKVVSAKEKGNPKVQFEDLVKFIEHFSLLTSEPSYSQNAYKNDPNIKSFGVNLEESTNISSVFKSAELPSQQLPLGPCNIPSQVSDNTPSKKPSISKVFIL